jgi:hypothetical protein
MAAVSYVTAQEPEPRRWKKEAVWPVPANGEAESPNRRGVMRRVKEKRAGGFSLGTWSVSSGKRVHVSNIQPLAPSIQQGIRGAGVAHSCCASGSQGTANHL